MNMIERSKNHQDDYRTIKVVLPMMFAGALSACGGPTTEPVNSADNGQTVARPSVSAAELSNDGINSVSFAQAVAAGIIENPALIEKKETASVVETPDTTILEPIANSTDFSNPLAAIPTIGSVDTVPEVVNQVSESAEQVVNNSESDSDIGNTTAPSIDANVQVTDSSEPDTVSPDSSEPDTVSPDSSEPDTGASNPDKQVAESVTTNEPATNPDPERDPEPEPSSSPASNEGDASTTKFSSSTTSGFVGEVLADTIKVNWEVDSKARGYNVYRQAQYITTVFGNEYIDEDVFDSDYYYEIQAFDYSDKLYYIATGLTVSARSLGKSDPNAPAANADVLQDYELVFSDEFNGSQLDASKWNTSYLWGTDLIINSEEQYYVDILKDPDFGFNPFTFDGNNLTINSIKTPDQLSSKALYQPYLSGVITSYDAFKFTYGYMETRAKVTYGRGYWPAFWLLNAYYVDDKPEIDIMEFIGQDQDVVYHTYHYYDSNGELRSTKSKPTPGIDYTSDFHTYAAEWRPGTIIFYVDGVERHRVDDAKVSRQDMYIIANTALGGWWAGSPDDTTPFPGEFTLDYIRVYQKTTPFDDDVLFNDGITSVPYADHITGAASPSHRPSKEDWPEGYPDGL